MNPGPTSVYTPGTLGAGDPIDGRSVMSARLEAVELMPHTAAGA